MSTYVPTKNRISVQAIAKISILGALASLIMMFGIPLPFAPDFHKLGLDEVIALVEGSALGPRAAVHAEAPKIALNLLIGGTITVGIGELTNFLTGPSFVLLATIIHQRNKTRKHALLGLTVEMIYVTILGGLLNYFIMLPAYSYSMNLPLDCVTELDCTVDPNISGLLALVLMTTTPLNVSRGVLCSTVVFLSYKKVSPVAGKQ